MDTRTRRLLEGPIAPTLLANCARSAASGVPAPNTPMIGSFRSIGIPPPARYITADHFPATAAPRGLRCTASPSHLDAMTPDVTLLAALLAGLVSFLSPCVLPLVPPYLVYLAGTSLERLAESIITREG